MNIEEIKAWLGQGEDEENRPNWPVTTEKLIEALVTVGIPEETAKSMFTSADPSLRILQEVTNDYQDTHLVIHKDAADISPWNNSEAFNWEGYFEGGNINMALILLVLCAKCNPLEKFAWGEEIVFYVNADWQKKEYGVTY
ncbi:MAG: hypothetical protein EHJ95_07005 [Methanobacteriota archaeon]|nr:MAG: hypothetical protein EHJ95_07005 [Euryarchaeota archaeon]